MYWRVHVVRVEGRNEGGDVCVDLGAKLVRNSKECRARRSSHLD